MTKFEKRLAQLEGSPDILVIGDILDMDAAGINLQAPESWPLPYFGKEISPAILKFLGGLSK